MLVKRSRKPLGVTASCRRKARRIVSSDPNPARLATDVSGMSLWMISRAASTRAASSHYMGDKPVCALTSRCSCRELTPRRSAMDATE